MLASGLAEDLYCIIYICKTLVKCIHINWKGKAKSCMHMKIHVYSTLHTVDVKKTFTLFNVVLFNYAPYRFRSTFDRTKIAQEIAAVTVRIKYGKSTVKT